MIKLLPGLVQSSLAWVALKGVAISPLGAAATLRPSTAWPEASERAWSPRPSVALVAVALRIAPPLRASAVAPTLTPSRSESAAATVYRNVRVFVPLPLEYAACRVALPIVSANRGVPVTVTAMLKPTCTEITAPRVYVPPIGVLAKVTDATVGAVALPFTLCAAEFAIACMPRASAAFAPPALRIVPPLSPSAPAATLIPSLSWSPATVS